jgi:hypothetical protein
MRFCPKSHRLCRCGLDFPKYMYDTEEHMIMILSKKQQHFVAVSLDFPVQHSPHTHTSSCSAGVVSYLRPSIPRAIVLCDPPSLSRLRVCPALLGPCTRGRAAYIFLQVPCTCKALRNIAMRFCPTSHHIVSLWT